VGPPRDVALRALVDEADAELAGAAALDVLRWADRVLRGRLVVATSLTDAVVIDLTARVHPGVDVVFLDTGYHFAETLGMRAAVEAAYDVRLLNVRPGLSVAEQDATYGARLHDRDPEQCCYLRKVVPLKTVLGQYDGWVTGLRRGETDARAEARAVEWDERHQMLKVNPIVEWSDAQVDAYVREQEVLVNPLLDDGYASIGCAPCTSRVSEGAEPRSGRWGGSRKTECGIHTPDLAGRGNTSGRGAAADSGRAPA
jgi:phosphoadenosine phosphosulfate reductase